jgi:preprotein translocase subunit SecF
MNIIGFRKLWYTISAVLIVPGIIALCVWHLKPGIDFKGGTLINVKFSEASSVSQVQKALSPSQLKNLVVQPAGQNMYLIETDTITQDQHTQIDQELQKIGDSQKFQELSYQSVGPTISSDLEKKAIEAIILASLAIIFYIAYAFRQVPRPASSWKFGVGAVLALIHDLAFVTGLWAILGHFLGYEIDSLFITGLLTIMGFSVHDTIVVFDRIRENLRKHPSLKFEENVNNSIIQTINRSLNTSLTVLIVLAALYFLGGDSLKHFILLLLVGIAIGTYSSIFNASPILVSWQGWAMMDPEKKKIIKRLFRFFLALSHISHSS